MNSSDDVRMHIDRLLQLHAIRVRALREEEIAINARTELLQRLTERLLCSDVTPLAAKNANETDNILRCPPGNDCTACHLPSVPVPHTTEFVQKRGGVEETTCEGNGDSMKFLHKTEPKQSPHKGPPSLLGSHRVTANPSTIMTSNSPIVENTKEEEMKDAREDNKKGDETVATRGTPSPIRRELDAFFPMTDVKHTLRSRQASSTAQSERHNLKECLSDSGTGVPTVQRAVTATDILAGIPCITTTESTQAEDTKSYVRTARRRQRDYAEDEAIQRTGDGRRGSWGHEGSLTPSSYWEIQFPVVPKS